MFTEHPESQKLVPALAAVPLNKLANNEDFLVLAHFSSAVASFIVSNLDNEDVLSHILAQQTTPEMFVSYVDPIYQLDVSLWFKSKLLAESSHCPINAFRKLPML